MRPDRRRFLRLTAQLSWASLLAPYALATAPTQKPLKPLRLLMLLWRGETPAEQGLLERLQQAKIPVELTRINAGQNRETLAEALWNTAENLERFDAVYSFGTTASVMAKAIVRGRIPQYYSMVSNPVAAGLYPAAADTVLTGSTDAIAASTRLRLATQLFEIKRLGFLFNAREQNARVQLEEVQALVDEKGWQLEVLRVAPEGDSLSHQLNRLRNQLLNIDSLYLPSDSYIISQADTIMAALGESPIRVIAATESLVRSGALLAIAPDYQAMGAELAERLLQQYRGEAVSPDPITVRTPRLVYNRTTAARLGITLSAELSGQLEGI